MLIDFYLQIRKDLPEIILANPMDAGEKYN